MIVNRQVRIAVRKFVGYAMLAALFGGLFTLIAIESGVTVAALTFGVAAVVVKFIEVAVDLIVG